MNNRVNHSTFLRLLNFEEINSKLTNKSKKINSDCGKEINTAKKCSKSLVINTIYKEKL